MKPMSTALVFSGLSWGLACSSEAPGGSESSERIPAIAQEFAGVMPAQKGLVWERDEGFLDKRARWPCLLGRYSRNREDMSSRPGISLSFCWKICHYPFQ